MSRTVLIVDDDECFRQLARRLLTARAFCVVADAADGETALAAAQAHRPDCVLLDVNLPDRDGFAVARALARGPDGPSVVLTSTEPCGWPRSALADCGVRAFVAKDALADADLQRLFSSGGI